MSFKKILFVPLLAAICGSAAAQTYPSRPVELIVPYSAGGSVDVMARAFGRELSEILST